MAKDDEKDTGPGRELTWGEALEARVVALEEKAGLRKGEDKAAKAADSKEEK